MQCHVLSVHVNHATTRNADATCVHMSLSQYLAQMLPSWLEYEIEREYKQFDDAACKTCLD